MNTPNHTLLPYEEHTQRTAWVLCLDALVHSKPIQVQSGLGLINTEFCLSSFRRWCSSVCVKCIASVSADCFLAVAGNKVASARRMCGQSTALPALGHWTLTLSHHLTQSLFWKKKSNLFNITLYIKWVYCKVKQKLKTIHWKIIKLGTSCRAALETISTAT